MSELNWVKSSFSDAGGNNCVEVAAADDDGIAIRDSKDPGKVLWTNRTALRGFIRAVRGGEFNHPTG